MFSHFFSAAALQKLARGCLPAAWLAATLTCLQAADADATRTPASTDAVTAGTIAMPSVSAAADSGGSTAASSLLDLKHMSVEDLLNQPVVSVSRRPEAWGETANNSFLIRGQAVTGTGATVLPDLLRMAPNLFVAQKSSSEWAINARGFVRTNGASNKLLVMVDGRAVYSPLFSNVFWESTSVFLPDLATVEVISGPAGATWGSNAVNGVINIQSKSAMDTLGGLFFATGGTDETSAGVRYGVKLGDMGAMRVYFQAAGHEATRSPTGAKDDYDPWRSTQGGFRADLGQADKTGTLTVESDIFNGWYENNPFPLTSAKGFDVLAKWSKQLTPDSDLWIRAYHDYTRRDLQDLLIEVSHSTDFEFQHHFKLSGGDQEVLWGADYRIPEDSANKTVGFALLPQNLVFPLGSVFGQHEIWLRDGEFRLTTGLRLEHNYFSGTEYLPSVRLAWKQPQQLMWISASRASRIPSRLDAGFYAPTATPPYTVAGGPDFTAEIVKAYELGWRGRPARNTAITATIYFNDYDNLRSVEPNGAAVFPYTVQNKVKGQSYGLELFVDWDVNRWWRLRAGGFSMQQHTWLKPGGADTEGGLGEASFPDYQVQLRNSFQLSKSLLWWTSLRRVGEVQNYESGNGIVPAYTELDMALNWVAGPATEITLSGRNLLDASHPEIGGLTARREVVRKVEAMVRFKF